MIGLRLIMYQTYERDFHSMLSGWWKQITTEIVETLRFRRVVSSFVVSVLRMRYRRSVLGFSWSMLGPMMNHLIVGLVFSRLGNFSQPHYLVYLLLGSITYNFMSASFVQGVNSLIANETYIRKVYLPKMVFPLSSVLIEVVNYLLGFTAILFLAPLFGGVSIGLPALILPIAILNFAIFIFSGTILLSVMGVYFRDLLHIVPIFLQSLFFITPIAYPVSAAPPAFRGFISYNPVYQYINCIRAPLIDGTMPSFKILGCCTLFAVTLLMLSLSVLKRFDNRIIFKL